MKTVEQNYDQSNAYSLFVYQLDHKLHDYYLRRLRIFFNYIDLQTDLTMEERCNYFANKRINDPTWAFNYVVRLLYFQKKELKSTNKRLFTFSVIKLILFNPKMLKKCNC